MDKKIIFGIVIFIIVIITIYASVHIGENNDKPIENISISDNESNISVNDNDINVKDNNEVKVKSVPIKNSSNPGVKNDSYINPDNQVNKDSFD